MIKRLKEAVKKWEEGTLAKSLARLPERKDHFETPSGIPVERLYLPREADAEYIDCLGFPGEHPFTRGVQTTMYRGRLWTMRQYAGYATAEETNARFKYLLDQGQTGLSIAFDLPTQIGYDADDPLASGEVGKVGVSISSLEDMEQLFDGIPLDKVSTSMTINAPAAILLAMYISIARRQSIDLSSLRGTIQNDILKEYIARGTYIFPPKPAIRLTTDVFRYCKDSMPRWNTISVSGYHMREAGATAVQELAFTLANAIAYLETGIQAGLSVDEIAPQMAFFFNAHNDLLEEIAKFRAARRMWSSIVQDRFGARDPRSWRLRFHTQTAGSTLTAQQPMNNITRVTIQALAAILGGTQSLHTNSLDEALSLPTTHSVQVALRTQQILAHESGVADTIDPLGGAYAVEALTDEIESRSKEYLENIDAIGGALAAVESGYMQREIQESAYRTQKQIECSETIVVGVNAFQADEPTPPEHLKVDPSIEQSQRARLKEFRAKRDKDQVEFELQRIASAARGEENLMPLLIEAVEAGATLGEICNSLREIWGEYRSPSIF
ncbi:MAG: methylmalonyl-CoA mutase family protein [Chloroflexota bacterium]|nr:methylmalonyl-CoA mutase family protein [Chloroflexota bacterium]